MSQPDPMIDIDELRKGIQRVGLCLSESELSELNFGNMISLETMELGKIGSLFILAAATAAFNLKNNKNPIAFQDLPKATQDCQGCSGIPMYCWNSDFVGKRCLYLTVIDGKPAVRVCCHILLKTEINTSPIALNS